MADLIHIVGFAGAILMGLSLGLIGGGGSILTVPILVYIFGIDAVMATGYSLFVVGITSLFGAVSHMRAGNVEWKTAAVFGVPSIITVLMAKKWLVPAIPDILWSASFFTLTKPTLILVLLSILMMGASYAMIAWSRDCPGCGDKPQPWYLLALQGLGIGLVTGVLGAGGGFLIIPGLVLLANLPMKKAVATSLVIITFNTLIGFAGSAAGNEYDWKFLLTFAGFAIGGILLGTWLSKFVPNSKLKPAFGWFVLAMSLYILLKETILKP